MKLQKLIPWLILVASQAQAAPPSSTYVNFIDGTVLRTVSVANPFPTTGSGGGGTSGTVMLVGTSAMNLTQVGGVAISLGQKASSASYPVVIASDQSSLNVSATISGSVGLAGTSSVNISQVGSLPITLGSKPSASSYPVVIASDQSLSVTISGSVGTISPVNAGATLSARQTVTGTETSLVAPTFAVGVLLECESVNADNLRWGFSKSPATILSSTLGVLCEPGRDSGYLPLGNQTYLHMISTGVGSDFIDVQWVLSQ